MTGIASSERAGVVVVGVLALALTLPLWLARFPIAQDLAAHIETAAQIRGLWRGDAELSAQYVLHGPPWPNALPTLVLAPLLGGMDGLLAGKLLVAVGLVGWPLSVALLLRRLHRPALLGVLALPTSYDLSFSYGFLHFIVGKPLWALALVCAVDVARRPTAPHLLRLALILPLLFSTHLLLFAVALPLCALLVLVLASTGRARLGALLALCAGAVPAALWWAGQEHEPAGPSMSLPLREMLARTWTNLGDLHDGPLDAVPWILCALGLVVAVVGGEPGRARSRETLALGAVVTALLLFSLLGPVRTPHVSVVAERFLSMAAALAIGVPPRVPRPRTRVVVVVIAAVAVAIAVADVTRRWRAFSREEMGDFDTLLEHIPAGARVATHYVTPLSKHGRHNALWHWPKLAALRGGRTDDSFAWRATCVVGLRDGVRPPRHPRLVADDLRGWDYLLVRGASASVDAALRRLPVTQVVRTGTWRLFRITEDTQDGGGRGPP